MERQPARAGSAIVIGAGVAGLAAAGALAKRFATVTIIERDRAPEPHAPPARRPGVPQGRHSHVLLPGGARALEGLFPGLGAELEAAGAEPIDWSSPQFRWNVPEGWLVRFASALRSHLCTRPLLEAVLRRRVLAQPGVRVVHGLEARGLIAERGHGAVRGVRARPRERRGAPAGTVCLYADLVIDASGRDSAIGDWLEALGHPRPAETVFDPGGGYATRLYRRRPGAAPYKALSVTAAAPHSPRGGFLLAVEGERWLVTLAGLGGDHPPLHERGFLEFARSLRVPEIYRTIAEAEPLGPIYGYRALDNRRRHLERIAPWPQGLIVLGDALCTLNPFYGQGMSVAALEAARLAAMLRALPPPRPGAHDPGLPPQFAARVQRSLPEVFEPAWQIALGADLPALAARGAARPGLRARLAQRYLRRVMAAATRDRLACLTLGEVLGLVRPGRALLRPRLLVRVLFGPRARPPGRAPAGDPSPPAAEPPAPPARPHPPTHRAPPARRADPLLACARSTG
ncbi:MAG: hypothetical protein KatS3mg102_1313 [Planctomycetota bacterium]|nr:MAG: hypothetical protein KatS3mg102_1313 [Planctomycetota bacterium]